MVGEFWVAGGTAAKRMKKKLQEKPLRRDSLMCVWVLTEVLLRLFKWPFYVIFII